VHNATDTKSTARSDRVSKDRPAMVAGPLTAKLSAGEKTQEHRRSIVKAKAGTIMSSHDDSSTSEQDKVTKGRS
jgi:hypothetical protein